MTVAHDLTPAELAALRDRVARARLARQAEDQTPRRNEPAVKPHAPDRKLLDHIRRLETQVRQLRNELEIARRKAAGPKNGIERERELRSENLRLRAQIKAQNEREAWCRTVLERNEILARKLREQGA